jgi:hypothetical protein
MRDPEKTVLFQKITMPPDAPLEGRNSKQSY